MSINAWTNRKQPVKVFTYFIICILSNVEMDDSPMNQFRLDFLLTEMQLAITTKKSENRRGGGGGGSGVPWPPAGPLGNAPCGTFRQCPLRGSRSEAALPDATGFWRFKSFQKALCKPISKLEVNRARSIN